MRKMNIPFQNLAKEEIQNLGLAALAAFYLALFVSSFYGTDDLAFWSAGHIANTQGYAAVYDIETLENLQRVILGIQDPNIVFSPSPAPYLPVFILPMQALAWFTPLTGFWIWRLVNLVIFVLYMRFLLTKISTTLSKRTLLLLILSFPVAINFSEGQLNSWLVIFVGEFLRAFVEGRYFRSGLWLGGLLLKPQTLVIILPVMLLRHLWKVLGGFSLSAAFLTLLSLVLGGWDAILGVFNLWVNYAGGIPTNAPENMVNWRMLGIHIGNWITPTWGDIITYAGMLLSTLWILSLWYRWRQSYSMNKLMLGTFAATLMITWHSHIHMGMLLIPPMAYCLASGEISDRLINVWLFLLPGILLAGLLIGLITKNPGVLLPGQPGGFLLGLTGLIINFMLMFSVENSFRSSRVNI